MYHPGTISPGYETLASHLVYPRTAPSPPKFISPKGSSKYPPLGHSGFSRCPKCGCVFVEQDVLLTHQCIAMTKAYRRLLRASKAPVVPGPGAPAPVVEVQKKWGEIVGPPPNPTTASLSRSFLAVAFLAKKKAVHLPEVLLAATSYVWENFYARPYPPPPNDNGESPRLLA